MDKYFIRSSAESKVKSQVATVPKVPAWGFFLLKALLQERKAYCDLLGGNNCCGLRHFFHLNTTVLKVNFPWEVIEGYSISVCCWYKGPTTLLKLTSILLKKKKRQKQSSPRSDAICFPRINSRLFLISWVWFLVHQSQSLARDLYQATSCQTSGSSFCDVPPTIWG